MKNRVIAIVTATGQEILVVIVTMMTIVVLIVLVKVILLSDTIKSFRSVVCHGG